MADSLDLSGNRSASHGAVTGGVALALRLEGAAALAAAALAYRVLDGNWLTFALLFLVPDVSMLGYLVNRSTGAAIYNIGHTYLTPGALALTGFAFAAPSLFGPALIWAAHIGFDRMLGYGLKYRAGFGATHLGFNGKAV